MLKIYEYKVGKESIQITLSKHKDNSWHYGIYNPATYSLIVKEVPEDIIKHLEQFIKDVGYKLICEERGNNCE